MTYSSRKKFIFTITPGHTGTTFLADLLKRNLPNSEIHHEILGYDKFGVDTPDVSHMTLFNSQGNVDKVKSFWSQKLEKIIFSPCDVYGETSHLLVKAGLMENISPLFEYGEVYIIDLRRNIEKIILSLRKRYDFLNKGNMWLWHLDPDYPRNLVNTSAFLPLGVEGIRYWYVCEMYARAEYYKQLFINNDNVHFISIDIDDLSNPQVAQSFLAQLGHDVEISAINFPPQRNVSTGNVDKKVLTRIRNMIKVSKFDAMSIVEPVISKYGYQSVWTL
jgi:hypothetical protein